MSDAFDPEAVSDVLDFDPGGEGAYRDVPAEILEESFAQEAGGSPETPPDQPDILTRVWDGLMAPVPDTPVAEVNSAFDGAGEWHQHLSLAIQGLTQAGGEPVLLHLVMAAGKYLTDPAGEQSGKAVEVQDDTTEWGMVDADA